MVKVPFSIGWQSNVVTLYIKHFLQAKYLPKFRFLVFLAKTRRGSFYFFLSGFFFSPFSSSSPLSLSRSLLLPAAWSSFTPFLNMWM